MGVSLLGLCFTLACTVTTGSIDANRDVLWPVTAAESDSDINDQVEALIGIGDWLTAERRWGAARRAYGDAARLRRVQGRLPAESLRRLANTYYFERDYAEAARLLDELAAEASEFGDLPVRARALGDAAWLHAKIGRTDTAHERVSQLALLIRSPFMPDSVRTVLVVRAGDALPPSSGQ
jgi:hypothetical protein